MTGLRRDLGTIESYATIIGILIGAGIFKVTSDAWALTGPSVILGYLVLAPAIVATSVAYSVFISTPLGRDPGGEYTHISRTFGGHGLAFVGVWLKAISYLGALAFLAQTSANYRPFFTHGISGFAAALPPLFFAYAGFESLAQAAGEVKDSTRRLPGIFLRGFGATAVLYLGM